VTDDIRSLAAEYYEYELETNPTTAHMRGDYRFADRFEAANRAFEDANIAKLREFGARARTIDPDTLDHQDALTREVLIYEVETRADLEETRQAEFAVDPIFGLHIYAQLLPPMLSVPDAGVAAAMVDKWKSYAGTIDEMTERFREGVASNRTPAEFAVNDVIAQLDEWLALPIDDDPLLKTQVPPDFNDEQTAEYRQALATAVADTVRPAVERHRDALRDEVLPASRPEGSEGLSFLPDGDFVYTRAINRYTTLPLQAGEIHEIGLQQIDRLAEEYRELGLEVLGTDDLEEIFSRLREDPALHHTSGADIVKSSEEAFARARDEMPNWFGRIPAADCIVQETPSGAQAFYYPGADDGSRPGMFFMNTTDPSSWGTYEVESTAFHEGIPGHHLQGTIAQELGDAVPDFRRHLHIVAYGEGWGLYSERVSDEMGIYGSQLDRMGMLSADSMRAGRLVVDTGMHALGWSRQQAINYLAENTPMSMHTITEEIDRYIASMPGQALSYMIGRLEIDRMRSDAEAALGDRFEIKAFHDTVLGSGAVPLETLDRMVSEWAAAQ
jgi:uncharacterized protein (DUF885 family)